MFQNYKLPEIGDRKRWGKRLENALDVWTIYFHEHDDDPAVYLVRKHSCTGDQINVDPQVTMHETLAAARLALPAGLIRFTRFPEDDPAIVETWL